MTRFKKTSALLAVLLSGCLLPASGRAAWHPANGPLMTRWAKLVSPTNALPEYPRPQMMRPNWQNLNGLWDYAVTDEAKAEMPTAPNGQILVPYPIEAALSGVAKPLTSTQLLWYRRSFTVPSNWKWQHILLHFGASDWESTVVLNGKTMGTHQGGYDSFSFDITDALRPGKNSLTVRVFDPTDDGDQPIGKQTKNPRFIWYTSTSGLWQTVWLEPVPAVHIASLRLMPDIDAQRLSVIVDTGGAATAVTAIATDGTKTVARVTGKAGTPLFLPIAKVHLWSPSDPHLYSLSVILPGGDTVRSYFAMRKISLGKDAQGRTRIMLNNKFVFQVGVLDQGFWPGGVYTAPTDAALRYDIVTAKSLGFNLIRKHLKVEPERWYYWTDRLGMLVWQDMPAANHRTPASKIDYEAEMERMIEGKYNHPSIIVWVLFNEGGDYDQPRLVSHVRRLDPSRLIDAASGWNDVGAGDIRDSHNYPPPKALPPTESRASAVGEFGGLGMIVPPHVWKNPKDNWGYGNMATADVFARTYAHLLHTAYSYEDDPGLSAVVYTQISDVEIENSGLMTYDRAVLKPASALVVQANHGIFSTEPQVKVIVPASEVYPATWRYTTTAAPPPPDWVQTQFDDSTWKSALAPFGMGGAANTKWNDTPGDIWLRRIVILSAGLTKPLAFSTLYDEDVEIYINGVLAASALGFVSDYALLPMTAAGRAALKPGKNTLAVHCHQTGGGQIIDVGIVEPETIGREK